MNLPVIAEVTRGSIVESRHRGSFAIVGPGGDVLQSLGDIATPVYPRSAIKAFQCMAALDAGVADRFSMGDAEIALACASHGGEPAHVATARAALAHAGLDETRLECGAHWPSHSASAGQLAAAGEEPLPIHNNCSGKHAFMLAMAKVMEVDTEGYVRTGHPVQRRIGKVIADLCETDLSDAPCAVDGCSVPTWAMPLTTLARGFQRFASGEGLDARRQAACARIVAAVRAHPFMVAGTGRFCTRLMEAVPRAFVKTGAEGVYTAAVPHAGIGLALKCEDGASRAAEVATAGLLATLDCWTPDERTALSTLAVSTLSNWRGIETGTLRHVGPT